MTLASIAPRASWGCRRKMEKLGGGRRIGCWGVEESDILRAVTLFGMMVTGEARLARDDLRADERGGVRGVGTLILLKEEENKRNGEIKLVFATRNSIPSHKSLCAARSCLALHP